MIRAKPAQLTDRDREHHAGRPGSSMPDEDHGDEQQREAPGEVDQALITVSILPRK